MTTITESPDDVRLRSPVLSADLGNGVSLHASALGGPKRLENVRKVLESVGGDHPVAAPVDAGDLVKLQDEREAAISRLEGERDGLRKSLDDMKEALEAAELDADQAPAMAAALDEILSSDVTSAKRAKEIAAAVRK